MSQSELAKEIKGLKGELKKQQGEVETVLRDCLKYCLPRLWDWDEKTTKTKGSRPTGIFTSAGRRALRMASDGIQGYLIPRSAKWKQMRIKSPMPTSRPTPDWYERMERILKDRSVKLFQQRSDEALDSELNRSNFYEAIGETLDIGHGVGAATVWVENDETEKILNFVPLHPKEIYFAENRFGAVDLWVREFVLTGKQLLETYGREPLQGSDDGRTVLEEIEKNPVKTYTVLQYHGPVSSLKASSFSSGWTSVYLLERPEPIVLREVNPFRASMTTWRYRVVTGEPYGYGPAEECLSDLERLNEVERAIKKARQLWVEPPLQYPEEYAQAMKAVGPGIGIPYRGILSRRIERIDMLGNVTFAETEERDLEERIYQAFHTQFFLMLSQTERTKTALEVSEIAGEKAAMMSAVIGRIESELLDPLLDMAYSAAYEAGRMPPVPDLLLELLGAEGQESAALPLRWDYVGPIAQLQKRHHGQQSIAQTIPLVNAVRTLAPDAIDVFDADAAMTKVLEQAGDEELLRREAAVKEIRVRRVEQQQASQQQQAVLDAMKSPAINQPVATGSPLEQLMQTAGGGQG